MQEGSAFCWKTSKAAHGRGRTRGQSFLFSFCVSCTGGRSYCARSAADAQPRNGRRAGTGDVPARIEVSGSWLHCVLSDKIPHHNQKRFGESMLKNLYCWYRKYFSVQSRRDLLKVSGRICCRVNRPSDLWLKYSDVHIFIGHFPLLHSASSCRNPTQELFKT